MTSSGPTCQSYHFTEHNHPFAWNHLSDVLWLYTDVAEWVGLTTYTVTSHWGASMGPTMLWLQLRKDDPGSWSADKWMTILKDAPKLSLWQLQKLYQEPLKVLVGCGGFSPPEHLLGGEGLARCLGTLGVGPAVRVEASCLRQTDGHWWGAHIKPVHTRGQYHTWNDNAYIRRRAQLADKAERTPKNMETSNTVASRSGATCFFPP